MHDRVRKGVQDDRAFGLAVRGREVLVSKLPIRMCMEEEPLAGVDELDEEGQVRSVPVDVRLPSQPTGSPRSRSAVGEPFLRPGEVRRERPERLHPPDAPPHPGGPAGAT
jgi:hypothetical protein